MRNWTLGGRAGTIASENLKTLKVHISLLPQGTPRAAAGWRRCMTARDRLRAWDVKFFGSSNLTHKSCGIFVASWGFAHCIGTRLVFHNFFISP